MADRMDGALQENILTLICFDSEALPLIRNTVPVEAFDNSIYRDIVSAAYTYYDSYKEAAGAHLPDLLQHELEADGRRARLFERALDTIQELHEAGVNSSYVLTTLRSYVREQALKAGVTDAVKHIQDGELDEAENALTQAMQKELSVFDPGLMLTDVESSLAFLDREIDFIPSGIPELDRYEIAPSPGKMILLIAPAKKGKSWWMVHLGKQAMMAGKRVLHISLEMDSDEVAMRYMQCIYSITKHQATEVRYSRFERDRRSGEFLGFENYTVDDRPSLADGGIRGYLRNQLAKQKRRAPIIVKEFPSGQLTIAALRSYLDSLERLHRFIPDLVLLDYADLMQLDAQNLRVSTGRLYVDLRGLAKERNFALATASQGNRDSATARTVTEANVAEDWSKIGTADMILTYSQTQEEKHLGLGRLFVAGARGDADKFTVLLSQAYAMGQFRMDSMLMPGDRYWRVVSDEEDEDD